jgi:hypothetical protein
VTITKHFIAGKLTASQPPLGGKRRKDALPSIALKLLLNSVKLTSIAVKQALIEVELALNSVTSASIELRQSLIEVELALKQVELVLRQVELVLRQVELGLK